jgi:hypothetical protein
MDNALKLPSSMVHVLTSAECEAKAVETEARLAECINPKLRRYLTRELKGWRRLAAERA